MALKEILHRRISLNSLNRYAISRYKQLHSAYISSHLSCNYPYTYLHLLLPLEKSYLLKLTLLTRTLHPFTSFSSLASFYRYLLPAASLIKSAFSFCF